MVAVRSTSLIILATCIFIFFAQINAKEKGKGKGKRFPISCQSTGFSFNHYMLVLKPSAKYNAQGIYFIHNISNRPVKLLQSRTGDKPYIIHINSRIHPNRWNVYASTEKKVKFICARNDKKGLHDAVIDCENVLDVCEFIGSKFGTNHRGNYWIVKNGSQQGAVRAATYHGIILRWKLN